MKKGKRFVGYGQGAEQPLQQNQTNQIKMAERNENKGTNPGGNRNDQGSTKGNTGSGSQGSDPNRTGSQAGMGTDREREEGRNQGTQAGRQGEGVGSTSGQGGYGNTGDTQDKGRQGSTSDQGRTGTGMGKEANRGMEAEGEDTASGDRDDARRTTAQGGQKNTGNTDSDKSRSL